MSLIKLLATIDKSWLGDLVESKRGLLKEINPERFYVENVRSFFNLSFGLAKLLCEMAVREKYFVKKIGLECPNDSSIIASHEAEERLSGMVRCETCEILGREKYNFDSKQLKQIIFYQLATNGTR